MLSRPGIIPGIVVTLTPVAGVAGPADPGSVLRRIKDVARVLDNFAQLREKGRARSEYMEQVPAALLALYLLGTAASVLPWWPFPAPV